MPLDSQADILRACLARIEEETGTDISGWYSDVQEALIQCWRDLTTRHPWLDLVKDPPGAFVTEDDITAPTITIAAAGTAVTGTLSANPQSGSSMAGRKLRPGGNRAWLARITVHTADTLTVTLDAVPEALAAGTALTIFQDEYTLASDVGLFQDGGMWAQEGDFIELWDEERLRREYPDPPSGAWPPTAFCRIGRRLIRLSHYPLAVKRVEYTYTYEPADPSGTGALAIPAYLRPVYLEGALAIAYGFKNDGRAAQALQRYEAGIERAVAYERRRRTGLGRLPHAAAPQGLYR